MDAGLKRELEAKVTAGERLTFSCGGAETEGDQDRDQESQEQDTQRGGRLDAGECHPRILQLERHAGRQNQDEGSSRDSRHRRFCAYSRVAGSSASTFTYILHCTIMSSLILRCNMEPGQPRSFNGFAIALP